MSQELRGGAETPGRASREGEVAGTGDNHYQVNNGQAKTVNYKLSPAFLSDQLLELHLGIEGITCEHKDGILRVTFPNEEAFVTADGNKVRSFEHEVILEPCSENHLYQDGVFVPGASEENASCPDKLVERNDSPCTDTAVPFSPRTGMSADVVTRAADSSTGAGPCKKDFSSIIATLKLPLNAVSREHVSLHLNCLNEELDKLHCRASLLDSALQVNGCTQWPHSTSEISDAATAVQAVMCLHVSAVVVIPSGVDLREVEQLSERCQCLTFSTLNNNEDITTVEVVGSQKSIDDFVACIRQRIAVPTTTTLFFGQSNRAFLSTILKDRFPKTVSVHLIAHHGMRLSGPAKDVDYVVQTISKLLSKKCKAVFVPTTNTIINWLRSGTHLEQMQTFLEDYGVPAALIIKTAKINVYCDSEPSANSAVEYLKTEIDVWPAESISPEAATTLQLHKHILSPILGDNAEIFTDPESGQIRIVGLSRTFKCVVEHINTFLREHTPVSKSMPVNDLPLLHVRRLVSAEVDRFVSGWNSGNQSAIKLKIEIRPSGFDLEGSAAAVQTGEEFLSRLLERVKTELYLFEEAVPGAQNLLRDVLPDIEKRTNTAVLLVDTHVTGSADAPRLAEPASAGVTTGNRAKSSVQVAAMATKPTGIQVCPVMSDLCSIEADVLVNSIDLTLDLSHGAIAKSFAHRADPSLQQELWQNREIKRYEHVVTGPHGLRCKNIIHAACGPYFGKYSEEKLLSLFIECLRKAEKLKASSVAFPAIGSGVLGYPLHVVFQTLLEAVRHFHAANQPKRLRTVLCSMIDPQHNEIFEKVRVAYDDAKQARLVAMQEKSNRDGVAKASSTSSQSPSSALVFRPELVGTMVNKILVQVVRSIPKEVRRHMVISVEKNRKIQHPGYKLSMDPSNSGNGSLRVIFKDTDFDSLAAALTEALEIAQNSNAESVSIATNEAEERSALRYAQAVMNAIKGYASESRGNGLTEISIVVDNVKLLGIFCDSAVPHLLPHRPQLSLLGMLHGGIKSVAEYVVSSFSRPSEVTSVQSPPGSATDGICITVYGFTTESLNDARAEVDAFLRQKLVENVFVPDNGEDLQVLTQSQIADICRLGEKTGTRITVLREKGEIIVRGCSSDNVNDARVSIKDYISRAAQQRIKDQLDQQAAEIARAMLEICRWQYKDDTNKWAEFDSITSMQIEDAVKKRQFLFIQQRANGETVTYYLSTAESIRIETTTSTKSYGLRRIDMAKLKGCPREWELYDDYLQVRVPKESDEYNQIASEFLNNAGASAEQVVEIIRIQDPTSWLQFQCQEEKILKQMDKGWKYPHKQRLWHGTSAATVKKILLARKFDRSHAGDAVLYGKGVYFARDASYAAQSQYATPDGCLKTIILAAVITGCFTKGSPEMRHPPQRPGSSGAAYDSTVDDEDDPTIFVVYNDTQAYPLYVITFK